MIERELIDYMLTSACGASVVASKKIMEIYEQGRFDVNLKSDNTIITAADTESHKIIKNSLSKTRIPLLSEEGRNMLYEERYRWDLYWLVDPIDGTREFVQQNDEFVICIALMYENKPLFGVIAAPAQGKLYFSDPDRGAFCVDNFTTLGSEFNISQLYSRARKLTPIFNQDNDKLRVIATRSHMTPETNDIIERQKRIYKDVEITQCGSSLKFCRLAEGEFDAYFRMTGVLDWDVAAGVALINAVGGKIAHITESQNIEFNKESLTIDPYYVTFKEVIL